MIKRGDLLFIKNKGFIFDKIRDVLGGDSDHVAMMLTDNLLVDATPLEGVAIRKLSVYNDVEVSFYRLKEPYQPYLEDMLNYCTANVGCKYDLIQTISLYFCLLFRVSKKINPIDIATAFVCSELIAQAAEKSGFSFNPDMATDRLTPVDIKNSVALERIL